MERGTVIPPLSVPDGHCMETVYSPFAVCRREEAQLGFSKHIKKHVRIRLVRGNPRLRAKLVTNRLLRSRTNTIELESLIKPQLAPTGTYEELELSRSCSRISTIIKLNPSSHLASAIHIKS